MTFIYLDSGWFDMIFYDEVTDAFKFIFSNYKAFFQIGTILLIITLIRRFLFYDYYADIYMAVILLIFSELMLYIEVGYCSYISLYTLKGADYLPNLIINKKLFFEGLKKSFAVYIYTFIILFLEAFKNLLLLSYFSPYYHQTLIYLMPVTCAVGHDAVDEGYVFLIFLHLQHGLKFSASDILCYLQKTH